MDSFSIDTSDMKKCARDLAEAGAMLDEVVPIAIEAGALTAAASARSFSSWSSRIPGSIHVDSAAGTKFVRAGGPSAPHAGPFEHGGLPGTFRHPVFGHKPWVSQQARPFLAPAAVLGADTTEKVGMEETDRVLRSQGL